MEMNIQQIIIEEKGYKKIIKNVKFIREKLNYKGDLIARMTCSGICDIYKSVVHLLDLNLFNHVH